MCYREYLMLASATMFKMGFSFILCFQLTYLINNAMVTCHSFVATGFSINAGETVTRARANIFILTDQQIHILVILYRTVKKLKGREVYFGSEFVWAEVLHGRESMLVWPTHLW